MTNSCAKKMRVECERMSPMSVADWLMLIMSFWEISTQFIMCCLYGIEDEEENI